MMMSATRRAQRGATLIVGLIMLVLLTLVVTSAFMLSSGNLKSVGNMQFRDEAIAAANVAIEQIISSDFTTLPVGSAIPVDIDQDGTDDYTVTIMTPVCVQAVPISTSIATLSGVTSGVPSIIDYNTVWDIEAQVSSANTGAAVTIWQGVRKRLTETQYAASACV
jgi:hypothetical protein